MFRVAPGGRPILVLLLLTSLATGVDGARYLIIAADQYTGILAPLAEWKTKKGVPTRVVPISQVGTTPSQIQAYIRNAYFNWPVRPEFVLLAGSPSQIPAYNSLNDCYYGNMTGDYRMEISVGRFFATTTRECSTMVNKVLVYEHLPAEVDTLWLLKGTTCVREDNGPDDTLYWGDSRLLHQHWQQHGYTGIDSFSMNRGNNSVDVTTAANSGRTFITYRGQGVGTWWSPFNSIDPFAWTNGAKLPIAVGATCATIVLEPSGSMYGDRFVRAGSPVGLGGAIAYFGTTGTVSHGAHYRSACFRGFFDAIYQEKELRLGPATLRGRWRCDSLYHVQARYEEWCLLGDPELNIWTRIPVQLEVHFDSVIATGQQEFTVTVLAQGQSVPQARVCMWMDSSVYEVELTDNMGHAFLNIAPDHPGMANVTVTGANLRPFEGTCRVIAASGAYLVGAGIDIDDFTGNRDGVMNPGEEARLLVLLRNIGQAPADSVRALLRITGNGLLLLDSTADYGELRPESTRTGDGFLLTADTTVNEGSLFSGTLLAVAAGEDTWRVPVSLVVRAGLISVAGVTVADSPPAGNGNGRLGRGESGRLYVALANSGGGTLTGTFGLLRSADTALVATDSTAHYGPMTPGQIRNGRFDWFGVSAGPGLARGQPVRLKLHVRADGGTYRLRDSLELEIFGEPGTQSEPTGPDAYGYYCYDDTDSASGRAPVYEWLELAPPGPGAVIPGVSDSDAMTVTLPLPFRFSMYGVSDQFVSVCSNGWLALGYTTFCSGYNRPLPDTAGPGLLIAPFWDDLNPDETRNGYGTAYQYYDTSRNRWLVEFKNFAHYGQPNIRESFQVALLDPRYYPTPTGDGEILYYYGRVSLAATNTVGIEDQTETCGIQYLYNNSYAPTAAWLQQGRACRFTTLAPAGAMAPWLMIAGVWTSDTLHGNGNGLIEAGETIDVVVSIRNRGRADALGVTGNLGCTDGDALVLDSTAGFGSLPPGDTAVNRTEPFVVALCQVPADSLVDFQLLLSARGYCTVGYFALPLSGLTTIAEQRSAAHRVSLEPIRPTMVRRRGLVSYTLASSASIDLAIYDAAGRRVKTLATGQRQAGRYEQVIDVRKLASGVYLCRLAGACDAPAAGRVQRFQVIR